MGTRTNLGRPGRHTIPNPKRKPTSERWSPETATTPMPKPTGYGTRPHPLTFHIHNPITTTQLQRLTLIILHSSRPPPRVSVNLVPLLLTGVRLHPPAPKGGPTSTSADVSVPRPRTHDDRTGRVFPDHLITDLLPTGLCRTRKVYRGIFASISILGSVRTVHVDLGRSSDV